MAQNPKSGLNYKWQVQNIILFDKRHLFARLERSGSRSEGEARA